ncbi:MAG: hypothetical protein JOZ52_14120, partial [Acidobacteria bacterium]|nr:hypothetical protein [Acidobacteriota bacterium]
MLLIAAFALFGVYRLARLLTNKQVAVATVICVALYPSFLSEALLAHREIACAALVVWGFYFYLQFGRKRAAAVAILISACALALWLSSQGREMMDAVPLLRAFGLRLWQMTGHGGLFVLTLFGLLAMTRKPLSDDEVERRRIDIGVQAAMACVVA